MPKRKENEIKEFERKITDYVNAKLDKWHEQTKNEIHNVKSELYERLYTNGDINSIKEQIASLSAKYEEKFKHIEEKIDFILKMIYAILTAIIINFILEIILRIVK